MEKSKLSEQKSKLSELLEQRWLDENLFKEIFVLHKLLF